MAKKSKKKTNPKGKSKNKAQSSKWKDKWAKNKTSYIFIGSILVFGIFSFWLTSQAWFEEAAQPLLNFYADISNTILNLLGQDTKSTGETISSGGFSIQIKKGCDAIAPMILYTLSILFFPVAFSKKPKGILIGIVLLFLLNIVRIVSLFLTGKYVKSLFDLMHTDVWQILFIIFTLYLWLVWLRKVTADDQPQVDEVSG